jgi:seryl-tRNA synthetase
MLNGTLTAIERTLTCIMENYYDSESRVLRVPEKLIKYFGREEIRISSK